MVACPADDTGGVFYSLINMEWLGEQIWIFGVPVRVGLIACPAAMVVIVVAAITAAAFSRPQRKDSS